MADYVRGPAATRAAPGRANVADAPRVPEPMATARRCLRRRLPRGRESDSGICQAWVGRSAIIRPRPGSSLYAGWTLRESRPPEVGGGPAHEEDRPPEYLAAA